MWPADAKLRRLRRLFKMTSQSDHEHDFVHLFKELRNNYGDTSLARMIIEVFSTFAYSSRVWTRKRYRLFHNKSVTFAFEFEKNASLKGVPDMYCNDECFLKFYKNAELLHEEMVTHDECIGTNGIDCLTKSWIVDFLLGTFGLKWHKTTGSPPHGSVELTNAKLSTALMNGKLEFTQAQWYDFGVIDNLTVHHVVKGDGVYFEPSLETDETLGGTRFLWGMLYVQGQIDDVNYRNMPASDYLVWEALHKDPSKAQQVEGALNILKTLEKLKVDLIPDVFDAQTT